jgi:hypothetical protein
MLVGPTKAEFASWAEADAVSFGFGEIFGKGANAAF